MLIGRFLKKGKPADDEKKVDNKEEWIRKLLLTPREIDPANFNIN